jgi:hypothetical protein
MDSPDPHGQPGPVDSPEPPTRLWATLPFGGPTKPGVRVWRDPG